MADQNQVNIILEQGVEAWNAWRKTREPGFCPDLDGADFSSRRDLSGINLERAKLSGAKLKCKLRGANFGQADLTGANFSVADLTDADISGARFPHANLSNVDVAFMKWDPSKMRQRYGGIRGIESCFGNALFKRAAADQDYLDTLELHWGGSKRTKLIFWMWGKFDYGRSMGAVAAFGFGCMFFWGLIYCMVPTLLWLSNAIPPSVLHMKWKTASIPFYYSVTTFTTLGLGDVVPTGPLGQLLAGFEVIVGYIVLGLLLAVLAEKLARRS